MRVARVATPVPCGRLGTPDSSGMRESGMKSGSCRRVAPGLSSRRQCVDPMGDFVPKMGDCAEVTRVSGPPYGRRAFDRVAVGREQQDGAVVDDDLHVAFVVLDA